MTMSQFGRTWWGQRFLAALEEFTDPGRLTRGRSYATNGRVTKYTVTDGVVTAKVRGSVNPYYGIDEAPIYTTTIAISQIPADEWAGVIEAIASRADLITKLLQQEMPDQIEEVFANEDVHLLPASEDEFDTDCSCPDWENPCKHIAGVYYLLARDLDRDPFVLFSMRGLPRKALQAELLKSPLGQALASSLMPEAVEIEPSSSLHTRPTQLPADPSVNHRAFWTGARRLPPVEPVPQVRVPALVAKKQGDYPAFWHKDGSFIEAMETIYERVRSKSPQMK
jgi:uncharacterized Zn finger protein